MYLNLLILIYLIPYLRVPSRVGASDLGPIRQWLEEPGFGFGGTPIGEEQAEREFHPP